MKAINGKHVPNKKLEILRGKHVVIESDRPHTWEIEGEIPSRKSTRMEVTYIPDAINLVIPKGWKYGAALSDRKKAKKNVLRRMEPFS